METNDRRLNFDLLLGWTIITAVLFVAYAGEVFKGERSVAYVIIFMACTALPLAVCWWQYRKNPVSHQMRYMIVAGYFVMYTFVMVTGSTILVFTYILPMLSLLILYHQPKLILVTAVGALALNLVFIAQRMLAGEITSANSKDVEIQLALLCLCFGECYVATRLYDSLHRENTNYIRVLDEKNKQIQHITLQTIETIANTIDAKDEYTKGHSSRVSEYSAEIASRLGMGEREVMNIRYIALLHDIGKIGVPDAVLNKPGKLTDAEYELIKKHTTVGGEILKDIDMLPDLDVGAKYHHERYDGKGYPLGLKGEEIPLTARIICLADAYDAMTSNRVYRKHLQKEIVLEELKKCRGKQFDPQITDVFLEYLENGTEELPEEEETESTLADASSRLLQKIVIDQNRQTVREAERDVLTQVYNRTAGERRITACLLEGAGCLLLINLDNMRVINRRYGFVRGDFYLQTIADILRELSTEVLVSRFGGDEFVCFLPGITDNSQIEELLNDFMKEITLKKEADKQLYGLSVSIGVTVCTNPRLKLPDYLQQADKALYHVKQEHKNGYYFYQQVKGRPDDFSKVDIHNLKNLLQDSDQKIHAILFTIQPENENNMLVEERDKVMHLMECAIINTLQDENAVKKYSSVQCVVMFSDDTEQNVKKVTDAIVREFYKMYDKKDIELHYDYADSLGMEVMEKQEN